MLAYVPTRSLVLLHEAPLSSTAAKRIKRERCRLSWVPGARHVPWGEFSPFLALRKEDPTASRRFDMTQKAEVFRAAGPE